MEKASENGYGVPKYVDRAYVWYQHSYFAGNVLVKHIGNEIPINLILLYLLIILAYLVLRFFIEKEDSEAIKVLMVNLGCGLFIIFSL